MSDHDTCCSDHGLPRYAAHNRYMLAVENRRGSWFLVRQYVYRVS